LKKKVKLDGLCKVMHTPLNIFESCALLISSETENPTEPTVTY